MIYAILAVEYFGPIGQEFGRDGFGMYVSVVRSIGVGVGVGVGLGVGLGVLLGPRLRLTYALHTQTHRPYALAGDCSARMCAVLILCSEGQTERPERHRDTHTHTERASLECATTRTLQTDSQRGSHSAPAALPLACTTCLVTTVLARLPMYTCLPTYLPMPTYLALLQCAGGAP